MKTDSIKQMISQCCDDPEAVEDLAELVAAVAEGKGQPVTTVAVDAACEFILDYIRQVPYMITVGTTSAANVGL